MNLSDLKPGDHLCCFFDSDEEHKKIVVPYIRDGLEKGQKVIYIVDANPAEQIISYLLEEGVNVQKFLSEKQLMIMTSSEAYLRHSGAFDPESMISLLQSEAEHAVDEGYSALRVTGEMTWVLKGLSGSDKLVKYEALLNNYFPTSRALAICQYDKRRFAPEFLNDMLFTHPVIMEDSNVIENDYYIPPDEFLGPERESRMFEYKVKSLKKRKQLEQDIIREKEEWEKTFNSVSDLIAVINSDYRIQRINRAMAERLGSKQEDCIGKICYESVHGTSEPHDSCPHSKMLEDGKEHKAKIYEEKIGGHFLVSSSPVFNGNNEFRKGVHVLRDINEIKRAEADRYKFEEQAGDIQKFESLKVLAGGIAHNFNNILMGILGYAELVRRELPGQRNLHDNIKEIEKAAMKAADLTNQMLAYSGQGQLAMRTVDIRELIKEMSHMLEAAVSGKADIRYSFDGSIIPIEADPSQINQIVLNLVINASEALGDNKGVITVSAGTMVCDRKYLDSAMFEGKLQEGTYAFLEVADTGCGIDKETISKIFDPFFSTKFTGRGMGLPSVIGIVRKHKGAVNIISKPGEGTSFRVIFPSAQGFRGK